MNIEKKCVDTGWLTREEVKKGLLDYKIYEVVNRINRSVGDNPWKITSIQRVKANGTDHEKANIFMEREATKERIVGFVTRNGWNEIYE